MENNLQIDVKIYNPPKNIIFLDVDVLQYAINCDKYENPKSNRTLVVTCLDQVPARIPVTTEGELIEVEWKNIATRIDPMMNTIGTWSDEGFKDK